MIRIVPGRRPQEPVHLPATARRQAGEPPGHGSGSSKRSPPDRTPANRRERRSPHEGSARDGVDGDDKAAAIEPARPSPHVTVRQGPEPSAAPGNAPDRRIFASLRWRAPSPHGLQISPFGAALSAAPGQCGTHRGWLARLARDHERSGSQQSRRTAGLAGERVRASSHVIWAVCAAVRSGGTRCCRRTR